MKDYLFTFDSTHDAISAENQLTAVMPIKIMALPSSIGSGCGICLRINEINVEEARDRLKNAEVQVKNIYDICQDNGKRTYKLWN